MCQICFQSPKAVSHCGRSELELLKLPIEGPLFQRAPAHSYFLTEALLCLNILNIFRVGPPPLTVLTLSNLQGGEPFPLPPPNDPPALP